SGLESGEPVAGEPAAPRGRASGAVTLVLGLERLRFVVETPHHLVGDVVAAALARRVSAGKNEERGGSIHDDVTGVLGSPGTRRVVGFLDFELQRDQLGDAVF